jgi:RNA polymerase sigma-70 factor, ECF subfamily
MIFAQEKCKEFTDIEIITRSLENPDYFSCLYQRYEPELIRYLKRIAQFEEADIHDILQDSFIKIWRNLNEYDDSLKLSSWIYRIVHNETISFLRKKKSYGKNNTIDVELFHNILSEEPYIESYLEKLVFHTSEVMESLPLKYREILILKFLEQKSYQEISDILKMPEGTVAIRINRAKKIFRNLYEEITKKS